MLLAQILSSSLHPHKLTALFTHPLNFIFYSQNMSIYAQPFPHKTLTSATPTYSNIWRPNQRRNHSLILSSNGFARILNEGGRNCLRRRNLNRVNFSNGWSSGDDLESKDYTKKRNVVDHICLLKAKGGLSEEEEKEMLDYLYTLQYYMGGIIAISLGCISDQNPDGYTHAVYMRFQRKEDLEMFYKNSSYLGVLKDHVMPFCHGLISVDYESEVEDDILPIFRKGEEFNYGVEFMLLISVVDGASVGCIEDALTAFAKLTMESPSLIAQATQGSNINLSSSQYTHAAVIRFRSSEAYKIFFGSPEYRDTWEKKFEPIMQKSLTVHFSIQPVGTEIM